MLRFSLSSALLLLVLITDRIHCDITDGNTEHLKREHSLTKPYQGVGSQWDFSGSTLVTSSYVRLTPDERSKQGSIWNTVPCYLKDWEMHVHFKVHGSGKKNLHGDGFALWYIKDGLYPGPVFGNHDPFHGLAILLDTFRNDLHGMDRSFPFISAMVNNGSLNYDHGKDGRSSELGGCSAEIRNREHDTYLAVRYSRERLTVLQTHTHTHIGCFHTFYLSSTHNFLNNITQPKRSVADWTENFSLHRLQSEKYIF
ncbi:vesicular integral-membrane protein VIP36-like [Gouania willdenowi]|uniref:vesicular integral-membrane protein VIP36-like n=1 Tax=Gouania willdenowi TaxID=441366 RepID=UPI0010544674|nr:vesicular integral-membrane protein VIP36-like [Gouania willdenowi]